MSNSLNSSPENGPDEVQSVASAALIFLAGEPDLFQRFAALTGLEATTLRDAAREPGFIAGLLDFFMRHEPTLMQFSEQSGMTPERIQRAWQQATGPAAHPEQ